MASESIIILLLLLLVSGWICFEAYWIHKQRIKAKRKAKLEQYFKENQDKVRAIATAFILIIIYKNLRS